MSVLASVQTANDTVNPSLPTVLLMLGAVTLVCLAVGYAHRWTDRSLKRHVDEALGVIADPDPYPNVVQLRRGAK